MITTMNKIKFALVSLALVLGFTACNKNNYEYEPGNPAITGNKVVFFDDEENLTLALTDTEVEITLNRADTEGELTVPLIVKSAPDFVTVPESATFAAGEAQTTVKLEIGEDMEPYVTYLVKICIPEKFTQPYAEDAGSPVYNFTLFKEDWGHIADGVFTSTVGLTGSWEQELQYSEFLNLYRLPDLFAEGGNVYFHYDGLIEVNEQKEVITETEEGMDTAYVDTTYYKQDFYFTDANGKHITQFGTAFVHPTYGELIAYINEGYEMGYDEFTDEESGGLVKEFYWVWALKVSAGSFGEKYQYYDVIEWERKPWEEKNAEE